MLIKKIEQKDNYAFTVEWTDGLICDYYLSDLQKHCPCISCRENRLLGKMKDVDECVSAHRVKSVGRFAMQIEFTTGCSKGIYPFSLLRRLVQ